MNLKVLIIIPAYNEEENILNTIDDIKQYTTHDYIVINDGSNDNTSEVCHQHNIPVLDMPINLGFSGAIQMGYKYASINNYDALVTFDGDSQHRAEYIDEMLEYLKNGYDYVIGSRFVEQRKNYSSRMIGSRLITFFIRVVTGRTIKDPTSGFRAMNKRIFEEFSKSMNFIAEPDAVAYLLKKGFKVDEHQVKMNERTAGVSHFNIINSIKYMVKIIISVLILSFHKKEV